MPQIDWNASLYDTTFAFVSTYGEDLITWLNPQPGESILDLGCGTGQLAHTIAATGAHVTGIDSSPAMIETAKKTFPDGDFRVADATNFSFPNQFDAVFSNATLHWIPDAERVIQNIVASLKPGGRFVAEFGGKGNVAHIVNAIQDAIEETLHISVLSDWYFPSIGEYTPLLEKHGLAVDTALLFDRPTPLADGEHGLRRWIEMFAAAFFRTVPPETQPLILEKIEQQLRPALYQQGQWFADYRRLRILAHKETL